MTLSERAVEYLEGVSYSGCGVYCLLTDGAVTYVGQTKDLHKRIMSHLQDMRSFSSVSFEPCNCSDMNENEAAKILSTSSPENKMLPPSSKAIRLTELKSDVGVKIKGILHSDLVSFTLSKGGQPVRYVTKANEQAVHQAVDEMMLRISKYLEDMK